MSSAPDINGIWNINKPSGPTSHDVVDFIRSRSGIKRVGHTGTLDPQASGVLVLCAGKATRLIEYMLSDKEYEAYIRLGVDTDTYDGDGKVVAEQPVPELTTEAVDLACQPFRGKIMQVPPMVSAKRFQGKRLYDLAREGKEVERKPVLVNVARLTVEDYTPPVVKLMIVCSTGTYVRSLAHDLGESLGCGAHLQSLRRLRVGMFSLDGAQTPEQWELAWKEGRGLETLHPMASAVAHLTQVPVTVERARWILNGRPFSINDEDHPLLAGSDPEAPPHVSLVLPDNGLFAVAALRRKIRGWIVRPDKIFQQVL